MKVLAIALLVISLAAGTAAADALKNAAAPGRDATPVKQTVSILRAGLLDCSGAIEVELGSAYTGDNTGLISNVAGYSCNPWYEPGGEVVFHVFLDAPTMFTAEIDGADCDLDLAILNMCDEQAGCIDVVDASYTTTEPVSGDIYFVVDGYDEWGCPFTLTLTEIPLPPAATFCDLAEVVTGSGTFYGYTCTSGENLVSTGDCAPNGAQGLESYYSIALPAGFSFTATLLHAADGALWVLEECAEPYGCLAFSDAGLGGDPETISYANTTTGDLQVYLVVDSYHPDSCGSYELNVTLSPGPVAVKRVTLGVVKYLYR